MQVDRLWHRLDASPSTTPTSPMRSPASLLTGQARWGIIVDGAGIGSAMVANKVPGIRAALCYDLSTARNSREHNLANVLTLGAGLIGDNLAWQIVQEWLATEWGGDRHARRVDKITRNRTTLLLRSRRRTMDREQLIDAVTKEVLAALTLRYDVCKTPEGVRSVVNNGADRVSFHGDASDVPMDLARYIDHTLLKPEAIGAGHRQAVRRGRGSITSHRSASTPPG